MASEIIVPIRSEADVLVALHLRRTGLGLPGSKRLMDEFDVVTATGKGTEVTMIKWER